MGKSESTMMHAIQNILNLSALHEEETSSLTHHTLTTMLGNAFHCSAPNMGRDGYLIAFDQDADYGSVNFLWFKSQYQSFVYIDRVVVAQHARGQGLARKLYTELFHKAQDEGHDKIVCEINVDPPNPSSFAFHTAVGFQEIEQIKIGPKKTVSYQLFQL
jgi:uncharacterized protein